MLKNLLLFIYITVTCIANGALPYTQEASVVEVTGQRSRMGTAFAISPNVMLTAYHVVKDEPVINITYGGHSVPCQVVAIFPDWDTALITAPVCFPNPLPLGKSVAEGEHITIYGYPAGHPFSRSAGTVTNLNSLLRNEFHVRWAASCTALVKGGYSGGPVVDSKGRVVGVLTNRQNSMFRSYSGGIFTRIDQIPLTQ